MARIAACQPDFLFSFYYRLMLKDPLLAVPPRGALNMHGSLLPKYRGRVPVNWAIVHGETETGATLHYMTEKPDNGDIVAQASVPILPDDTAGEVFGKVTLAAEAILHDAVPGLVAGMAPRRPQDPRLATYFGGRRPEDGVIDWSKSAAEIHNLVRAVAPPYPGAFTDTGGHRYVIERARLAPTRPPAAADLPPGLAVVDNRIAGVCGDGGMLWIASLLEDGAPVSPDLLRERLAAAS